MKFLLKTIILFLVFNSALAMEIRSIKKDKVFSKASYELNDTNLVDINNATILRNEIKNLNDASIKKGKELIIKNKKKKA